MRVYLARRFIPNWRELKTYIPPPKTLEAIRKYRKIKDTIHITLDTSFNLVYNITIKLKGRFDFALRRKNERHLIGMITKLSI